MQVKYGLATTDTQNKSNFVQKTRHGYKDTYIEKCKKVLLGARIMYDSLKNSF